MASRFACLEVDVDVDERTGKKKPEKVKAEENLAKKNTQNKVSKKKKHDNDLLALAFGGGAKKNKKKNNSNKEIHVNQENDKAVIIADDEWKKRDDEFVKEENERILREGILASKLAFEEKKTLPASSKDDPTETKGGKVRKKKDKPQPMSLYEFKSLKPNQLKADPAQQIGENGTHLENGLASNEMFFKEVDEVTKKTLEREARHAIYKATAGQFSSEIRVSQFEEDIEKRDFEIQALRLEVESLKEDLRLVKTRNKKLCEIICSAEMKGKAELVVELDKMTKVRDELTQEVTNLAQEVQQERSKVNQLSLDLKKTHGKKKQNAETVTKE